MRSIVLLTLISVLLCFVVQGLFVAGGKAFISSNVAHAEGPAVVAPRNEAEETPDENKLSAPVSESEFKVQAILNPKSRAVVASAIDGKIAKFNADNGSLFKKDDVLIEYDCSLDYARLKEAQSRQKVTQAQLEAYKKLRELRSASEIEFVVARENNIQNLAIIDQINSRLKLCKIVAPFDGRVTKKIASQYEFVQTGRVLLDISSRENLRADFLVSSNWLRWMNIGTPLRIYIGETDRYYMAKIVTIHGEVDPVSQFVQVVAEIEAYHEELLPGMSGFAIFEPETTKESADKGFLGLVLDSHRKGVDESKD